MLWLVFTEPRTNDQPSMDYSVCRGDVLASVASVASGARQAATRGGSDETSRLSGLRLQAPFRFWLLSSRLAAVAGLSIEATTPVFSAGRSVDKQVRQAAIGNIPTACILW